MGNIFGSLISGFTKTVGSLFGTPLDFLSGKYCSSACGPTWDLICYIENFCISNLVKLATVLALLYIVLLFFYLVYKTGICHCIGRSMCKMLWACLVSWFSACEHGGMFIWFKMKNLKQMRRDRLNNIEVYDSSSREEKFSYRYNPRSMSLSRRSRERRKMHLEKSLKPRSHRIRVGVSKNSVYVNESGSRKRHRHSSTYLHDIKVTHTSKFVHKGNGNRIHRRRW